MWLVSLSPRYALNKHEHPPPPCSFYLLHNVHEIPWRYDLLAFVVKSRRAACISKKVNEFEKRLFYLHIPLKSLSKRFAKFNCTWIYTRNNRTLADGQILISFIKDSLHTSLLSRRFLCVWHLTWSSVHWIRSQVPDITRNVRSFYFVWRYEWYCICRLRILIASNVSHAVLLQEFVLIVCLYISNEFNPT